MSDGWRYDKRWVVFAVIVWGLGILAGAAMLAALVIGFVELVAVVGRFISRTC